MRVTVYPADDGGCGHFRLIYPTQTLQTAGHPIELVAPGDTPHHHIEPGDIVVIQRPLHHTAVELIGNLQAADITVVVEIDDDFHAIHPHNTVNRELRGAQNPIHLAAACDLADLVTVTTPALARRYGRHGRVAILPNLIPASYLATPRSDHHNTFIGWAGSLNVHPDDHHVCGTAITDVLEHTGAYFAVIGTGIGIQQQLRLRTAPLACGWVRIDKYPTAVAHLDIGTVPLQLSAFNEAKSNLKGLQYAALGVPFVASPTAEYRRLANQGVGLIADTPADWYRHLHRLVTDRGYRTHMAQQGRNYAATQTYEEHASRWWDAWTVAAQRKVAA